LPIHHIFKVFHGIRASLDKRQFFFFSPVSMASGIVNTFTNSSTTLSLPNFPTTMTTKLENSSNYLRWTTQVLPALRSNEVMGIVDGTEPCPPKLITNSDGAEVSNPAFSVWTRKDQHILSWLTMTLSDSVLSTVYGLHTARQVWTALASKFASQSRSRISHLKQQLQSLRQGTISCPEYLQTAKSAADQLAAVDQSIPDGDLIAFVMNGLNPSYNTFITTYSLATRDKLPSFDDFSDELLNFEMLLTQQQRTAAAVPDPSTFALFSQKQNPVNRTFSRSRGSSQARFGFQPRFNPQNSRFPPPQRYSQHRFPSRNFSQSPASPHTPVLQSGHHTSALDSTSAAPQGISGNLFSSTDRIPCQICGKLSHNALDCFHRMDYSYQGRHPPPQLAAMVAHTNSSLENQQWLADSGANAHITGDINNLQDQQPFLNTDAVTVGNGTNLTIEHTGSTLLHSLKFPLHLKNILHCPKASSNLLSIQKLCADNSCYFILTASHFFVKDLRTHSILLEGKSENGLYPLLLGKNKLPRAKTFTAFLGIKASSLMWHFRLGHPSFDVVNRVVRDKQLPVSSYDFNKAVVCVSCQLGKSKKLPFQCSSRISVNPLELIHTDIWTSPVYSVSGLKYYVIFIDDYSRFSWIYPLHLKSEVLTKFIQFKLLVENQFSTKIKQVQSDGGGEYISHHFQSFLAKHGITHRKSCPYTSQQNGLAERKLRHILETGLTLLAHSSLSNKYWADAFVTAVHIINRLPTPILDHKSPFSKLHSKEPDYHSLRVFGCQCFPLLRPYTNHKLEYRSKPCVFLGYSFAGYKCLDPITNKVYLSRHVIFDETKFPAKDTSSSHLPSKLHAAGDSPFFINFSLPIIPAVSPSNSSVSAPISPVQPSDSAPGLPDAASPVTSPLISVPAAPAQPSDSAPGLPDAASLVTSPIISKPPAIHIPSPSSLDLVSTLPSSTISSSHPMVTRSKTGSLRPKTFPDFKLFQTTKYPLLCHHTTLQEVEPTCYSKAVHLPHWQVAMQLEYDALMSNGTWSLCPRPLSQNIIRNKWVYKVKRLANGSIERFKARLVAKGFDQQCGVDYMETFSPVIKPSTIRIILSLAVHFSWSIRQLDVSNAFLHGHLAEEVYMEQPQGFHDKNQPDFVCRLHKAIYGLKQAPRAWFTRLSTFLLDIGFTASLVDNSLFVLISGAVQIYILVYVDDIILTGTHPLALTSLICKLQQEFPLKDLGPLSFFLGIQVSRSSHGLHLCQKKYITDILTGTHMDGAKPAKSPCSSASKLSRYDGTPLDDPSIYRHVVGALQYCTLTRPEISFSVNQLCQHLHSPTDVHLSAAKRVLRYLKGSIDHGIWYSKSSIQLNAFCDSDWAGDPDDRRSTSGFAVFLGSSLISWSAKKQPVVSRSSTEAEYRSLAIATTELYWLRMLFKDLHVSLPLEPVLWCDNVSALSLASNPVYHASTKHIEVDYHFVREKVINRDISIRFISTHDQIADIFTKGLSSARFLTLKSKLLVVAPPINLRGAVNISPLSSIDSPRADNDSPHKAQLHERLNAVATLSSPHSDSIQRLSRDSKIR
jgi:hypothetical protein